MNSNLKKVLVLSCALTVWDIFSLSYRAESWSCSRLKDQLMAQAKDYFSGIYYLNRAVESGDLNAVKRWLAIGVNVNRREYIYPGYERTPLETAIKYTKKNKAAIVKLLIAAGANINKGSKEATPLYQAVTYENREAIKLLVQHGAELLSKDSVLKLQCSEHDSDQQRATVYLETLEQLLDDKNLDKTIHERIQSFLKPPIGSFRVVLAVVRKDREAVKLLIQQGEELLSKNLVLKWQYSKHGYDIWATVYLEALQQLLDDNKNLHKIIRQCVQNFLEEISKPDIDTLKAAIKYGTVNSVKSLLDMGLRLEDVDKETLLYLLCAGYNAQKVAFLIERGFLLFSPAEVIEWRQCSATEGPGTLSTGRYIETLERMVKNKNTSEKARQYAEDFLKGIEEEEKNLQRK